MKLIYKIPEYVEVLQDKHRRIKPGKKKKVDVFRGYRKATPGRNWLNKSSLRQKNPELIFLNIITRMIITVSILERLNQKLAIQETDQLKIKIAFMKSQSEFQRKRKIY